MGTALLAVLLLAVGLVAITRRSDETASPPGIVTTTTTTLRQGPATPRSSTVPPSRPTTTTTTGAAAGSLGAVPPPSTIPAFGPPRTGGKLVVGVQSEVAGFDLTQGQLDTSGLLVAGAIFDPLFTFDGDGRPVPFLASAATPEDDGRAWTIELRPGVRFHDDTPVDAAAVVADLDAMRRAPRFAPVLRPIEAVETTGPTTVRVRLRSPWSTFPAALTGQAGMVAAPSTIGKPSASSAPVGSGPFRFGSWQPDRELSLLRNDRYWGRDPDGRSLPYLDAVEFRPMPDASTRLESTLAGDVDLAIATEPATIRTALDSSYLQYVVEPGATAVLAVALNTRTAPLDDVRVRRALAMATDQAEIADAVGTFYEPIDGSVHGLPRARATAYPATDAAKAAALVAEYQRDTGRAPSFTLAVPSDPIRIATAQLLQSRWRDAGIEVSIRAEERTAIALDLVTGRGQATLAPMFGESHPDQQVASLGGDGAAAPGAPAINVARLADPEIDEAFAAARGTTSDTARWDAYARVQDRLAELVPYVWVAPERIAVLAGPRVRGLANGPGPDGGTTLPYDGGAFRLSTTWLADT